MVRAAVSGAINYTGADPLNRQWRLKHRLLIDEVERQEDYKLLLAAQQHWLALLSHGRLTEESFKSVKKEAGAVLTEIQKTIFPWVAIETSEENTEKAILDERTQALVERYKAMQKEAG